MKKIVLNKDYGGFRLTHAAMLRWAEIKGINLVAITSDNLWEDTPIWRIATKEEIQEKHDIHYVKLLVEGSFQEEDYVSGHSLDREDYDDWSWRMDPALVQVVEELGAEADGRGDLQVIEIPDDLVDFYIEEYDGWETLHEAHRRF